MKFLSLVYGEESALRQMPDSHCLDYDEEIRASGHCVASEALQPVATASTVRVRNGKVTVTDGPFAETKRSRASTSSRRATWRRRSGWLAASRRRAWARSRSGRSGPSANRRGNCRCNPARARAARIPG